ncbi:hypothetical protein SORBI_3002G216801 [Sorghum bicolor]|uniref:Peptidase A1 domain-containing protein n=1 Tax=Sorghum bicolor TaxID=4558 RepID=A0A1W0W5C6_SORBI|nr:hypothetical protein SORBI_3002G216801 [Sorghum bicolor]
MERLLQTPTYVVRARLGTLPQQLLLAVDTSNDAAWIPCAGCVGCPTSSAPPFDPAASTSYRSLPCGSPLCVQAPNAACPPGGKASRHLLVCLPSFKSLNFSGSGTLRLGRNGQPQRIKTTPLLANPHRSSLYYVNMTGIRVGRKVVPIPPPALAFDPATGAGTVLDSGTMFTRLVAPAYVAVRDEVRRRVGAPVSSLGGFDTCFNTTAVAWPPVTLLFDGMQVTLPEENVVIHSTYGTISCLAMAAAPDGVNTVLNVIASMQQQNHRVLFDVPNGRVGFARERCTAV